MGYPAAVAKTNSGGDLAEAIQAASYSEREAASRDLWVRNPIEFLRGRPAPVAAGVVRPESVDDLVAVVQQAAAAGRNLVPLSAGSGVCGGIRPGPEDVILDLKGLRRLEVRPEEGVVHCGSGVMGRHAEAACNRLGYTIGHFPSSIACSAVGGWVAARGAGQLSSRYGKIEDICVGARAVLADGSLHQAWRGDPALDEWVGNEGALAVIAEATLRIRPLREGWTFAAFMAPDLRAGLAAARQVVRQRPVASLVRLYDPIDSRIALSAGAGGLFKRLDQLLLAPRLLRWVGDLVLRRCLLVFGWEGTGPAHAAMGRAATALAAAHGLRALGAGPGETWLARRHDVSFKQIAVVRGGHFADTMEVACPWTEVATVYHAVRAAVAPEALSMAHFSHAYSEGCAVYFSMTGHVDAYERTWQRAMDAVDRSGATLSHHHGVGRLKADLLPRELGGAHRVLVDCKTRYDPEGRLNPGVLGLPGPVAAAEPHRRHAGLDRTNGLWTGPVERRLGDVEAELRAAGWTLGVATAAGDPVIDWLRRDQVAAAATCLGSARARLVALEGALDDEDATPFGTRVAPRAAVGPNLLPRLLTSGCRVGQVTLRLVRRPQRWLHLWLDAEDALQQLRALLVSDAEPWAAQVNGRRAEAWFTYETPAEQALADAVSWPGERQAAASRLIAGLTSGAPADEPFEQLQVASWRPWAQLQPGRLIGLDGSGGWQLEVRS